MKPFLFLFFSFALCACGCSAAANADTLIAAQEVQPGANVPHAFWTPESLIDTSLLAGFVAADGITTQQGLAQGGREMNPLMRPFVTRGAPGEAAGSALGFSAALGTVYLLHRTHHYKAERFAMRFMVAGEGAIVGNNIAVLH